jgi:hypothetical protein
LIEWSKQNRTVSFSLNALPFTDMMLNIGNSHEAVLLTDDELYHTSLTVKEHQVYTPALFQQKNWSYLRVFSRSWWMDRESTENELHKFIYQLTEAE